MMGAKRRTRWLVASGLFLACLLHPMIALAQQQPSLQARLRPLVAQFFGVPPELLKITSVRESTLGERAVYSVYATVVTPEGRTVDNVFAHIDFEANYVTSAGRRVFETDDALHIAEAFARANFPAWSERMVLQEARRSGDKVICRWGERDGEVWTGSFVGLTCSVYRPGIPTTYIAYVATPRRVEDIRVTREEAVAAARRFLAGNGYKGQLQYAELHLDDLNWRFPFWWVAFQARREGATAEQREVTLNVLVHAMTGEIVEPRVDEQQ